MPRDDAVVITGLGAVSPNGVGVPAFTSALRAGRSGLRATPFAHEHVHTAAVGAVEGFDAADVLGEGDARRLPRLVPMALVAAREAMAMAGLGPFDAPGGNGNGHEPDGGALALSRRVGLMLGTGGGGIDFTVAQFAVAARKGHPSLWTITNATHGNLAGELSIRLGLRGPSHCVSTGCTSSSDAIGTAMLHLRAGRCDAMVVGGADAHLTPEVMWSMELLGVMSTGAWRPASAASRPFDRDRDGFVLGEGAWFVVMERAGFARSRGADVLAEVAGYGSTCDAYHRVRPDPAMTEAVRAIALALEDAGVQPADVGYVHYHGTGTPLNDAAETRAIRTAFGRHADRLPGSSVKSMIGHPQGACGAAAVVSTIASLRAMDSPPLPLGEGRGEGSALPRHSNRGSPEPTPRDNPAPFLPPTINLAAADPECDLDYVANTSRPSGGGAGGRGVENALINCLAFGAKNSALVLRM